MLKRQEKQIRKVGDYAGSVKPPKFDINKPTPYPYDRFRRGVAREGWKPATKPQWRAWFKNHNKDTWVPMIRHTLRAHFAEGVDYCTTSLSYWKVEGAIDAFFEHKLVIAPWNLEWCGRPFWGMMDSEAKAKARRFGALAGASLKRHDDDVKRRASLKAGKDKKKSHQVHYEDHKAERVNKLARERGEPEPKQHERSKKLREWEGPKKLEKCPDCLQECFLVDFEHAHGGSHNGELRCSCCPRDNKVARYDYDASNHAVFLATERDRDMTAADHAALVEVDLAFARPHEASAAALERREWARRAAVSARVPALERIMNAPTPQRRRRDTDRFDYAEEAAKPQRLPDQFGGAARLTAARRKAGKGKAEQRSVVGARVALGGAPGVLTAIEERGWYKVRLDGEKTVRSARWTNLTPLDDDGAAPAAKPTKRVARARKVRTPVAGTGK